MVSLASTAPATAPSAPRLHSLDALRAGALLLGIVLHGLMAFLPGELWLVNDVHDATWPVVVIGVIHMFRMALFMAIAGYFSRRSIERHGVRHHLRGRVLRVLLPLFVFWPIAIVPLAFISVADAARRGVPVAAPPSSGFQTGHLWFLWVLFLVVVVVVVVRWIGRRLLGAQQCAVGARRVSRVLTAPGGVLLAAVPYAVTMLVQNSPTGMLAPAGLELDPVALFGFGGAFVVGWLLAADPDALERLGRVWPAHLAGAAVASVVVAATVWVALPLPVVAVAQSVGAWCWVFGLIGLGVRHLTRERPWVRYLADAAFWMYLMHMVVVLGFGELVAGLDWPILVKIVVTWMPSVAVLLATYDLFVRSTWLGAWINGRRYPRVLGSRRGRTGDPGQDADVH